MDLRLFVLEPESLRRRLLAESIAATPGLVVLGAAGSFAELPGGTAPDVFLVATPLIAREADLALVASRGCPDACFVLFGAQPEVNALLASLQLPVRGYLAFNHLAGEELLRSLQVIAYGGAVIEPLSTQLLLQYLQALQPPVARPAALTELTQREEQILAQVRQGLSNKEIALGLHISLGTVRAHLRSIFRKLEVTSRAGAAARPTTVRGSVTRLAS